MDDFTPRTADRWRRWWPLALALNLIVPLMFGLPMTDHGGRIGMVAAIGLLWYLGHRICGASDAFGRALVIGSFLVAATQFLPVLQFFSGIVSVAIARALGQGSPGNDEWAAGLSELGGLIATGFTGLTLMGAAAFCGAIVSGLTTRRPHVRLMPGSELYDRQLDG